MATTNPPASQPTSVPLPKSRRGLRGFLAEVGREMKKVNWPTKHETNRLTGVVIVLCLSSVLFLLVLHNIFRTLLDLLTKGF